MANRGWVGVDLDGTLAYYDKWRGIEHIGEPIRVIQMYVLDLLNAGVDVRIFTARVDNGPEAVGVIESWCLEHLGRVLPVTNTKDMSMVFCLDDRAIAVEKNTGVCCGFLPTDAGRGLALIDAHWSATNEEAPPQAVPQADGADATL